MRSNSNKLFVPVLLALGLGLSGAVAAQYVWLDEKGVKQFSDRPPPASVPISRIVKQPGGIPSGITLTPDQAASSSAKTEPTLADKNLEFRKRQAEQAEKEKKSAEEAKLAKEKSKNCDRAREYQQALDSGQRIGRTDKNGERSYLTDEERAREMRDVREVMERCK